MKFAHLAFSLLLVFVIGCSKDDDPAPADPNAGKNPVYLDANGITVKAHDWAKAGDKGEIDGVVYTVVDDLYLRAILPNHSAVKTACTTRVTDMSNLFAGDLTANTFNQDISSWDVSNVTSMRGMFTVSVFNKPIGTWDVSKVTDMSGMFWMAYEFNQDLSTWNTANVQDCANFSTEAVAWQQPQPAFANCNVN